MFNQDINFRSLSKSAEKRHRSVKVDRSADLTNKSLLTASRMYYVPNDRIKNLSETIKARVLKKYHETIESDKKPNTSIKLKDEEFRKIFKTRV